MNNKYFSEINVVLVGDSWGKISSGFCFFKNEYGVLVAISKFCIVFIRIKVLETKIATKGT